MTHATEALELLTLKSLRTLAAAIQGGSLTRAAVERGLAQSAVSRQIAELERALGGALFYRTGRGVKPTALAEQMLPRVSALLSEAEALVRLGKELTGVPSGLVTLGLVWCRVWPASWQRRCMARWRSASPRSGCAS